MPSHKTSAVKSLQQSLSPKGVAGGRPDPETEEKAFAGRLDKAIGKIVDSLAELKVHGGANREAVIVLLCDKTGFGKRVVRAVFDGLDELYTTYCMLPPPPPPPPTPPRELWRK